MNSSERRKEQIRRHYANPHYVRIPMDESVLSSTVELEQTYPFTSNVSTRRYHPRPEQHYGLLLGEFEEALVGSILDMGSRTDTLQRRIGRSVARFDKNNPELPVFDWENESLPVKDASYDTVVCLDTLEHIDSIHDATDDLFRAARKSVIISLPNCWKRAVKGVLRGRWENAGYGIPPERHMDRHKWFFNAEEAFDFLIYRAEISGWTVARVRFHAPREAWWQRLLFPWFFSIIPEHYAKNWFTETLMVSFVPKTVPHSSAQ